MTLADLLTTIVYLLLMSVFPAIVGWLGLWFPLMIRKRGLMTVEERERFDPTLNPSASLQFLWYESDAIRHDLAMRRMRLWRAILFCWPFGVAVTATVYFNFFLPQIS